MSTVIGITGTIGSGKSAVGNILSSLGVPVIDTDRIVHDLLTEPNPVRTAVVERFGEGIVKAGDAGAIDREKLGAIVFKDSQARRDLEAIVHPATILECRRRVQENKDHAVVALLVPLLFEARVESEYDQIWTVVTDEKTLRERLQRRDSLNEAEMESRLAAQMPQAEKAARAHHTIDNSGTLEETARQVKVLLENLK